MLHRHPGGASLSRSLIERCAFKENSVVLDLGCGTGETAAYLQAHGAVQAIGVDAKKERLREGEQRHGAVAFLQADGANLPFADASIDGVIMECSLSVMRDRQKTMQELSRVLVPGGKLGITDLYSRDNNEAVTCCLPAINHASAGGNAEDLLPALNEAGFQLLCFEDHTDCLKAFVASYIMQYGLTPELQAMTGASGGHFANGKRKRHMGYFLLVAEKRQGRMKDDGKATVSPVRPGTDG